MGGLLLGDYAFLGPEYGGAYRWATWHIMPPLREPSKAQCVEFLPIRYFDTIPTFSRGGPWAADAVLIHTSPPDPHGFVSLGVSVSYPLPIARQAPLVIAEVNERMPRTLGNALLHLSEIDWWVETSHPLVEYPPVPVGEVERRIAAHVAELIPDGATVQIGIGSLPQAIMETLVHKRDLGIHSLLVDHMIGLVEKGVITNARKTLNPGRMDIGEIMGTDHLFRFAHENPIINMEPSSFIHNPMVIARIENFVSINSALEVDLSGQVNAESLGEEQVSGIGGQYDFVEGAYWSPGGKSIIALPSTSGRGAERSRIVPRLAAGTKVTTPRYLTDHVVTEYGVAHLKGKSESERARALIAIAHPKFRDEISAAL